MIQEIATNFNIEPAVLTAVILVESAGKGFFIDWNGNKRIKIQFEPHWFVRFLKKKGINVKMRKMADGRYRVYVNDKVILENKVDRQWKEWNVFNRAWKVDQKSTMLSTSWGLGQIMGFNYVLAGYASVGAMITDFRISEKNQLMGMMNFIKNTGLLKHLQTIDFAKFAKGYNGKNYKLYNYDVRLARAYQKAKNNSLGIEIDGLIR